MKKEKKQFAKANCFFYNNKLTFHFMDIILFIGSSTNSVGESNLTPN